MAWTRGQPGAMAPNCSKANGAELVGLAVARRQQVLQRLVGQVGRVELGRVRVDVVDSPSSLTVAA